MSNIRFVRLITGEGLVGEVTEYENTKTVILKTPVTFTATQEGVAMIPFSPFAEHEDIELRKEHVVYNVKADEKAASAWDQAFGTKLVLPSEPKLIV